MKEKLIDLRKKAGLSQQELAEKIDVTRQAISRWEVGSALPTMENLLALRKLYGVTLDYLVDDAVSKPNMAIEQEIMIRDLEKQIRKQRILLISVCILLIVIIAVVATVAAIQIKNMIIPIEDMPLITDEATTYVFNLG